MPGDRSNGNAVRESYVNESRPQGIPFRLLIDGTESPWARQNAENTPTTYEKVSQYCRVSKAFEKGDLRVLNLRWWAVRRGCPNLNANCVFEWQQSQNEVKEHVGSLPPAF